MLLNAQRIRRFKILLSEYFAMHILSMVLNYILRKIAGRSCTGSVVVT